MIFVNKDLFNASIVQKEKCSINCAIFFLKKILQEIWKIKCFIKKYHAIKIQPFLSFRYDLRKKRSKKFPACF